ncbi:MAG: tandem-95 repeat protein [Candidatus Cloacimonetes bacterium]|nr:tandem-95 repeat protein [Candidatus Cloacimonadota bacterium]
MIHRKQLILCLFLCLICLIFADPPELYLLTEQIFEEDGVLVVDFVADSLVIDNDGDDLLITIVNNEHILAEEAGSVVSFTALPNWNGSETISFFADDQNGGFVQGYLDFTVLPVNDPPVIDLPAIFSFMEGESLVVNLNDYVTEVDGDALSLEFSGNENIYINVYGNLIISLMTVTGWTGEEIVFFTVDDGISAATDSVMIVVTPGNWNHAPEFIGLPLELTFEEDTQFLLDLEPYIFDADEEDEFVITVQNNIQIQYQVTGLQVAFSASPNWYGVETLQITVYDTQPSGGRAYDEANINVNVIPVNDAPVIDLPVYFEFEEDQELIISFAEYIYDIDDDELMLTCSGNDNVMIIIIAGNIVQFTAPDWFGSEIVTFTVIDENGASASDDVEIVVVPGNWNHAPEINLPAELSFNEDTVLTVDFSMFVNDIDGDDLVLVSDYPENIAVQIYGLEVIFIPDPNWFGNETMSFTVYDTSGNRLSATGETDILVIPVNDPPVIDLPQNFTLDEGEELYISFADYISDIDDDELMLTFSGNFNVFIEILAENIVYIFAPDWVTDDDPDWVGTEVVTFTVTDENMASASDDVDIVVEPGINHAPRLYLPEEFYMDEDTEIIVDFNNMVYDDDGDDLVLVSDYPENITVLIDELEVTFIPDPNWYGSETISFTVYDTCGERLSCTDTTYISVYPVNDAPVIDLPPGFAFEEGYVFTINLSEYYYDVDGDLLVISYSGNDHINIQIFGSIIILDAEPDFMGTEIVVFTVTDEQGASASDSVEIEVMPGNWNHPPEMELPDYESIMEDSQYQADFSLYVYDPDDDDLVLTADYVANLDIFINGLEVTIIPAANWYGATDITFTVYDTRSRASASDVLNLEVLPQNDPPTLNLPGNFDFIQSEPLYVNFNDFMGDIDGDVLWILPPAGNENIGVSINNPIGIVQFWLVENNWFGSEMISFTVSDDSLATATDSVLVTVYQGAVNSPPQINLPAMFNYDEDTEITLDFAALGYIFDIDGDEMMLSVSGNSNVTVNINGTFVTFSALENWFGDEVLTFYVMDENNQFDSDNMLVQVSPVNDAPMIFLPRDIFLTGTTTMDFEECIYDPDGDDLELTASGNINVIITISGYLVTFSVIDNWTGIENVIFTVDDNQGATGSDDVNIIYYPSNNIVISKILPAGWNWFSLNVTGEEMSVNNVLLSLSDAGTYIKNQTQFASYYPGTGWLGPLSQINNYEFYRIDMIESGFLEFTGAPVSVSEMVYDLAPGWNWISYAPQDAETTSYALDGLNGIGSYIKNQTSYATYYDGIGWLGPLSTLVPLDGYMLNMNSEAQFIYPMPEILSRTSLNNDAVEARENDMTWIVNPHDYEFNGSLTISSETEIPGQSIIVAKIDDEIRGVSTLLDYTEQTGRKYFALMVYGNLEYEEGFQLYYQENADAELVELDYGFAFEADMITGDFINPVMITLPATGNDEVIKYTDKLSVYPNPFNPVTNIQYEIAKSGNVLLEIYNLKGQKVETLVNEAVVAGKHSITWNAENMSSGIYLLRYETGDMMGMKKVILLK